MVETVKIPAATNAAVVVVQSAWWSKINWLQAIGIVSAMLVHFKGETFGVPDDLQTGMAVAIPCLMGFFTWLLRTFFTKTITPSSAKDAVVNIPEGVSAKVELRP